MEFSFSYACPFPAAWLSAYSLLQCTSTLLQLKCMLPLLVPCPHLQEFPFPIHTPYTTATPLLPRKMIRRASSSLVVSPRSATSTFYNTLPCSSPSSSASLTTKKTFRSSPPPPSLLPHPSSSRSIHTWHAIASSTQPRGKNGGVPPLIGEELPWSQIEAAAADKIARHTRDGKVRKGGAGTGKGRTTT